MSPRWQRRLRIFPLTSEFNVPYLRCARGELLSLDVSVLYTALREPRRLEPVAYWRARLDAELERALRGALAQLSVDEVCRQRLRAVRAVADAVAADLAADLVALARLELLSPTRRPLGGQRWTRVQRDDRSPGFPQAPSHQEV